MTTALFIGRFAPAHKGHIAAVMKLLSEYDKVIIGLGSCYEAGSQRHPLLAVFREKMLLLSVAQKGGDVSKITVVYIQDYSDFEGWINDVLEICNIYNVTHFVTGNKEEILDVLKDKNIKLPFTFVNPEEDSRMPYHATDLRRAVANGDFKKFADVAAFGTLMLLGDVDGLNGIRSAFEDTGRSFLKGRQTVDLIFTMQERIVPKSKVPYLRTYVLCGVRPENKPDFPNYLGLIGDEIEKYESPITAVLRALKKKAGIDATLENNLNEPAIITIKTDNKPVIAELRFLQLYNGERLAGTQGGSSQAFQINIMGSPSMFNKVLKNSIFSFKPVYEVLEQTLAYEQSAMLRDAVNKLNHYAR